MAFDLPALLAYHDWANGRYLDAVAELSQEEWKRRLESSFPSIQATVAHLVGAEWIWWQRWQGESPTSFPVWIGDPSPTLLRARLTEVESERSEFLSSLGAGAEERQVPYRLLNGTVDAQPLGALVHHLVNHATFHRGQIATLLRQLGHTPPSTDLVLWLRNR